MRPTPSLSRTLAFLAPAFLFIFAATLVIASHKIPHRVAYDQLLYHQPTIEIFAAQWPDCDISDYLSATTPGYHLLLAGAVKFFGIGITGLQIIQMLVTALLLVALGFVASRHPSRSAFVLALPAAASMYIFASGVWILPDNAAWLLVLVMLLIALSSRLSIRLLAFGGIILLVLTLTRQIHFWTAGLLIAAAYFRGGRSPADHGGGEGGGNAAPEGVAKSGASFFSNFPRRAAWASLAVFACAPSILVLAYFYRLWHGLTPPSFQGQYHFTNWAGPAFVLSVFGIVAFFYAGYLLPRVILSAKQRPKALLLAVGISILLAAMPKTTSGTNEDYFAGRRTGLWDIAKFLKNHGVPDIAHHTSLFIVAATVAGALAITSVIVWWRLAPRLIVLAAFVGYGIALAQGGELWQRYAEPFAILMAVIIIALDAHMRENARDQSVPTSGILSLATRAAPLGPIFLTLAFIAINVRDLRKPDTQLVTDPPPPAETVSEVSDGSANSPRSIYLRKHPPHPAPNR